jgi:hypothetical protein
MSYKHHNEAVRDLNWHHDGKKIITAGFDKYAVLTDVETGKAIQVRTYTKPLYNMGIALQTQRVCYYCNLASKEAQPFLGRGISAWYCLLGYQL